MRKIASFWGPGIKFEAGTNHALLTCYSNCYKKSIALIGKRFSESKAGPEKEKTMPDEFVEKRSEPRKIVDKFYSVEFALKDIDFVYQFKIWNMSSQGMCVLIKEDSVVLKHLKAGDIVDMKYYSSDSLAPTEHLQTEIRHITKDDEGRFKGHCLVGLSILLNEQPDPP